MKEWEAFLWNGHLGWELFDEEGIRLIAKVYKRNDKWCVEYDVIRDGRTHVSCRYFDRLRDAAVFAGELP